MKTLNIELIALDLEVCDRCGGTLANLKAAIRAATPALRTLGLEPALRETLVESLEQTERLRFASSPTIRIDGREIMGTPRESACVACTDLSGGEDDIDCRVWPWRGTAHDAAPVGLIVEALMRAALAPEAPALAPEWSGVPANIRAFLAGRASRANAVAGNQSCCGSSCGK